MTRYRPHPDQLPLNWSDNEAIEIIVEQRLAERFEAESFQWRFRLVMIENIHEARHLANSKAIQGLNVTVIESLRRIIARGEKAGIFRKGLDPIDLHMTISALCFFNVANRATFSTIFKRDMASPHALAARRAEVVDIVWRYVRL